MLYLLSLYPQIVHVASGHSHYDGFWRLESGQTLSIGGFAGIGTDKDTQGLLNNDSLGLEFRTFVSRDDGYFVCQLLENELSWTFHGEDDVVV